MREARLLVTGSRSWWHRWSIERELDRFAKPVADWFRPFVVVHGNANGADYIARLWVRTRQGEGWPVRDEPHPADWQRYARRAGMVRNAEMVELGADLCLAFIRDASKGATACADMAEKAGIQTIRFTWEQRQDGLLTTADL